MVTTKILLVAVALVLVVSALPSPHHRNLARTDLVNHRRPHGGRPRAPQEQHPHNRRVRYDNVEDGDRNTRHHRGRRNRNHGGLVQILGNEVGGVVRHGLRITHLRHFGIFGKICNHETTGIARDIFLEMSKITQAATNLNEVLYLQVRSIYAIVRILNAWIAGFGDIFGIMANYVFRVAYCVQSEIPRLAPGIYKKGWGNPDFCRPDYVSKWDTRRYSGSYSNALEVYNFFGVQDYIGKFDILASSYEQEFSTGTREVIFRSFKLLIDICRRPYSQWTEQDIATVYRITVTIVSAFGGSYNRNRGLSLAEAYVGHFSSVAQILGLDISAHYGIIKKDIRKCDRTSLNNAFSIQTQNRHFRISKNARYDLSRFRTYGQVCSHKKSRSIFNELGRYRTKISTFQDAIKITVTLGRGLQHILNSWIRGLGTYYLNTILAFVRTVSCTSNGYYSKWHTKYGWSRPEVCNKDFGKQWNWRAFRGSYTRSSIYRFHRVSSSQKFVERLWSSNKYTHVTEKRMLLFIRSSLNLLQKSSFGGEDFGGIIGDLASLYGAVGKAYDGNLGIHMANDVMNTYNDFATKLFQVNWASYTQKVQRSIEAITVNRLRKAIRAKGKKDVIEVVNDEDTNDSGNTGSDDEKTDVSENQDSTVNKTTSTTNEQVDDEDDDDDDDDDIENQQSTTENPDDNGSDGDSDDYFIRDSDETDDSRVVDVHDDHAQTTDGSDTSDTSDESKDTESDRTNIDNVSIENSDSSDTDLSESGTTKHIENDQTYPQQTQGVKTTRQQTNGKKKCSYNNRRGNKRGVKTTPDIDEEYSLEEDATNSEEQRRKNTGDSGYEQEDDEEKEGVRDRDRRPHGRRSHSQSPRNGKYQPGDDDEDLRKDKPRKPREPVRLRHNKQHPLSIFNPFSLIFSSQRLSRSIRSISRTRRVASNYNEGFEVIVKLTNAMASFVDSWRKPGLGKLLRKVTMSILRIYGCTTDGPIRKKSQLKGWGNLAVCKKSYGRQWGFEPYKGSYSSVSGIYDYYGQEDIYRTLQGSFGDLSGSERVVGEAILDLARFSERTNKNNLDIAGFANVYGYYITMLTALAKSHNVKLGDYVERALHSYYQPLIKISGVEIESFRSQWQKRTANCGSTTFGNVIQNTNSSGFVEDVAGDSSNDDDNESSDSDADSEYDATNDDNDDTTNNSGQNTRSDKRKENKNPYRKTGRNNDGRTKRRRQGVRSDTSEPDTYRDESSVAKSIAVAKSSNSNDGSSSTSTAGAVSETSNSNDGSSSTSAAQAFSETSNSNDGSSSSSAARAVSKTSNSNDGSSSTSTAQAVSETSHSEDGKSSRSAAAATARSRTDNSESESLASAKAQSSNDGSQSQTNSRSSVDSQSSNKDSNSNTRRSRGSKARNEGSGKEVAVNEEDGQGYGGQSSYAGEKSSQSLTKDSSGNVDARRQTEGGSGRSETSGSQVHRKSVSQNENGQMSREDWRTQQQAGSANERHQSNDQIHQSGDGFSRTRQESAQSNSNLQKQNAGASETAVYGSDGSMSQQQSSFTNSQSSTNNAYTYKTQTVSQSGS